MEKNQPSLSCPFFSVFIHRSPAIGSLPAVTCRLLSCYSRTVPFAKKIPKNLLRRI